MSPDDRILIWDRLVEGERFGQWIYDCGLSCGSLMESAALDFLLIEYWDRFGLPTIRLRWVDA